MFKFLKSLFKQEEVIELSFENLGSWFEKQAEIAVQDFEPHVKSAQTRFNELKKELVEAEVALESAKLRNENIPEKAKHFMEGNRATYIKITNQFVKALEVPKHPDEFLSFEEKYKEKVAEYTKASLRPFKILQEFFANESMRIAKVVRDIDVLVKDLKIAFEDLSLDKLQDVRNGFEEFDQRRDAFSKFALKRSELKTKLNRLEKQAEELDAKEQELKKSSAWEELQTLKRIEQNLQDKTKAKELEFFHKFAVLETALKKYERIALNNASLLRRYLDAHMDAFMEDSDLTLYTVLQDVKQALSRGAIDVKDKKKEKTEQQIETMTKEYLETFKRKYKDLLSELSEVQARLSANQAKSQFEKIQSAKQSTVESKKSAKEEITDLENRLNTFDEEKYRRDLIELVKSVSKKKIVIV